MDGVETTKALRELGYDAPIVALTANAVAGQADIFLANGFDDYISKPVDIRQLNLILNKLVRDKKPPEVVEAARADTSVIDPGVAGIFLRDAKKALAALDEIMRKDGVYSESDLRIYTIHTHGIKSALANIGKMRLSAAAMKLEQAARDGDVEAIASETPAFINGLRAFIGELTPEEEEGNAAGDDTAFLKGRLLELKTACEGYDVNGAEKALAELKSKPWSKPVKDMLGVISEHLLHSDFEEVTNTVDRVYTDPGS
jgi:CheY-like chemotaxis protein